MKPVYIKINDLGDKFYYSDKLMTIIHREDGPAYEGNDGTRSWYLNGKLHREDGPAYEGSDGSRSWWLNGKRHREDGPAIEGSDGTKQWWLNGKQISQEEHARLTHLPPDTGDDSMCNVRRLRAEIRRLNEQVKIMGDGLKTIAVSNWRTAGELRKMARDGFVAANGKHMHHYQNNER